MIDIRLPLALSQYISEIAPLLLIAASRTDYLFRAIASKSKYVAVEAGSDVVAFGLIGES
jgi:hypothetical protein